MKPRNLFATKTLQGLYIIAIAFLTQGTPAIDGILDRSIPDKTTRENTKAIISLVVLLGGLALSTYGRYDATNNVYTPDPLPGRDEKDIELQ